MLNIDREKLIEKIKNFKNIKALVKEFQEKPLF